MARPSRKRRPSTAGHVPAGVSKEEWQVLPQILELLRSGALFLLMQFDAALLVFTVPPNCAVAYIDRERSNKQFDS